MCIHHLLLLLALAGAASADTGLLMPTCPEGWILYHTHFEASCLKLMKEPKLFDEALKSCFDAKSRLLSFSHRKSKAYFVNALILRSMKLGAQNPTLWFFDPHGIHKGMVKSAEAPKPDQWMVISSNRDLGKIALLPNADAIPHNYICEAPTYPAVQRPQFLMEPEDLFIADSLVKSAKATRDEELAKGPMPFTAVTFNCQAYGKPKPTVKWRLIDRAGSLLSEAINAKVITDPREPLNNPTSRTDVVFYELQRDCRSNRCPKDSIQERSQLIVVNPQFLDPHKSVACVASNAFGSVLSREAWIVVAMMGDFARKAETVTVKAGITAIVSNAIIAAEPNAASAVCFRLIKPAEGPAQMIAIEHLNHIRHGGIQMSRATFDLIIDAAGPVDAGDYLCRASMYNGRMGHVIREKTITLKVEPCSKADGCDLAAKPVAVAEGYPRVLSMNPLSNRMVRSGDNFLLECPCTGKRRPKEMLSVNWSQRNRTDMAAAVRMPLLPQDSVLLMSNASRMKHSGRYSCQCVRGQEKSPWQSVHVEVLPSIKPVNYKSTIVAKRGQNATYECRVDSQWVSGLVLFLEPMRGTQLLADYIAQSGDTRLEIEHSKGHFTVSFKDVKEADAGVYGCRVTANFFESWKEHDTYYTTLLVEK